jgi:hypothetical protein
MPKVHKPITRKVKEELVKEFKEVRGITGNGFVFCGPKGGQIDQSVCIVQQVRNAGVCRGCKEYKP